MLSLLFNTVSTVLFIILSSFSSYSVDARYSYEVDENIVYKTRDGAELTGDLYLPEKNPHRAAVVTVHGGSWSGVFCDMRGVAIYLAKRGFVVFNVRYRLAPEHIYPTHLNDVADSVRFFRENAPRWNVDPDKIAIWGYSSGAHIALYVGLDPENKLNAIVAGGSPADFSIFDPVGTRTSTFMGGTFYEKKDLWLEASPVRRVQKNSPPTFLYHGIDDKLTLLKQMENMRDALRAKDVPVETHEVPFWGHATLYIFSVESVERATQFLRHRMSPIRN